MAAALKRKSGAVGRRRRPQVGVKDHDGFVGDLQRFPESLNFGGLRRGPAVTATTGEVGTAGLGPWDQGFLDNRFNKFKEGEDGFGLDLTVLFLGQLAIAVGFLEFGRLFSGVDQEGLDGWQVNDLRRRIRDRGVIFGEVVPQMPLIRTLPTAAVGPPPFWGKGPAAEVAKVTGVVEHIGDHHRSDAADSSGHGAMGGGLIIARTPGTKNKNIKGTVSRQSVL